MKGINLPVLLLLIFLICGIVLAPLFHLELTSCLLILGTCLISMVLVWLMAKKQKNIITSLPFYCSFFTLGMLLAQLNLPANQHSHFLNTEVPEQNAKIKLRINEVLKPSAYADRYIGTIKTINDDPTSGKVLLYIDRDSLQKPTEKQEELLVDGLYYLKSAIKPVPKPKDPYQFDYAAFLQNQGVYGQISLSSKELFLLDSSIKTPLGFAAGIRKFLQQRLGENNFTPDQWGVINALLLGQRQELSEQVSNRYRDAGVIHILAVSGLHVGIVLLILQCILKPLGNSSRQRFLRSLLVIIGIWFFALLTGLSPSILRAATMFTFLQVGLSSNRKNGGINGLIASALVLLVIDPSLIYQVGFQLSYLAVFFILWLQPELAGLWRPRYRVTRYFWDITTVSLSAQLGVLPLSLFYFHQFPGLFLLANFGVLPLLGLILGLGLLLLLIAALYRVPDFFAEAYGQLITWLNNFIAWVAHFDVLVVRHIYFSLTWMLLAYLLLTTSILLFKRLSYQRIMLFLTTILIVVITLGGERLSSTPKTLYVLYKSRKSIVAENSAEELTFYSNDSLLQENEPRLINTFIENQEIKELNFKNLRNIYGLKDQDLLIVDSLGIYKIPDLKPDFILLTQSPQINLKRMIARYPEAEFIADGNNYKSYVNRWEKTCDKLQTPFHSTYKKGYFLIQ